MNPVLQEIINTGVTQSPDGKSYPIHSSITPQEGAFLQKLIHTFKPVKTLEVGLAYGISALYICDALSPIPSARHIIIDPYQYTCPWGKTWGGIGMHNLRQAGYEAFIEFYGERSYRVLPILEREGRKIDFAFIDGWHTFDYTMVDLFYIDKILKVGGILIFDDADWPAIRKVCRYLATNLPYSVIGEADIPPGNQIPLGYRLRRFMEKCLQAGSSLRKKSSAAQPESDESLGLTGRFLAFRKDAEDTRKWDFHREF